MRILHVADFTWFSPKRERSHRLVHYYASGRKINNGLIRNGHNVWELSYRDTARYLAPLGIKSKKFGTKAMNESLLAKARLYQPQLLLLGHAQIVAPATLAALRQQHPQCKIAFWWLDWFADRHLPHLQEKLPYLDAFFATTAPSYYRQNLGVAAGATPALHYLPNLVDASVESERAFAAQTHESDLLFIGADSRERAPLLARLQQLPAHIRCGFFGFAGKPPLVGRAFIHTIGASKMGLNLSRLTDVPMYSSSRLAQLTGNGCLALTPRTPQMQHLYSEDEVAYYDNDDHLLALIEQYSSDDTQWRQRAEAGWRRAHASYNERRVAKFIVEAASGGEFSERYEWLAASGGDCITQPSPAAAP